MKRILLLISLITMLFPSQVYAQQDEIILCYDEGLGFETQFYGGGFFDYDDVLSQTFLTDNNEWTVAQVTFNVGMNGNGDPTDIRVGLHETEFVTGQWWGEGWIPIEDTLAEVWFNTSTIPDAPADFAIFDCDDLILPAYQDLMLDTAVTLEPNTMYGISYRKDYLDNSDGIKYQARNYAPYFYSEGGAYIAEDGIYPDAYPIAGVPLRDDFNFVILGVSSPPIIPVPQLFLFAYVGLAIIGVSLLLGIFGAPMIGIIAVNVIIFLMAIGLEYIPSYMLIIVMMAVGIIILMAGRREAQGN